MESFEQTFSSIHQSLKERGYNPVSQLTGYLLTEDHTYITNHNNARVLISQLDREEVLRELLKHYLDE